MKIYIYKNEKIEKRKLKSTCFECEGWDQVEL